MSAQRVVTIGSFDGVHRGHAAIMRAARGLAGPSDAGGRVVALTFFPHPLMVLRPASAPARLTTWEDRAALLGQAGADEVVQLQPTRDLLSQTPEQFVRWLVQQHSPDAIVEGTDFRFGKGRRGDVRTLAQLGERHGFHVEVVPPVEAALTDQTLVECSSTLVRWLLARGRVGDARRALGRTYEVIGRVEPGDGRGRELGFPTLNLAPATAPPGDGVYAAIAHLPSGERFAAAVSVGSKPTFPGSARAVEAHLLDWSGQRAELGPVEGDVRLVWLAWLRDQIRYASAEALIEQMRRDSERTVRLAQERWEKDDGQAVCSTRIETPDESQRSGGCRYELT